MTRSDRDPDDLAGAPFLDDDERADAAWLAAADGDPAAPPRSPETAREYADLEASLVALRDERPDAAGGADGADDAGWQDAVFAAARAPEVTPIASRRARRRWLAAAAAVVLAAAIVLLVVTRGSTPAPAPRLAVAIAHGDVVRGDRTEAAVGDRLIVTARPDGAAALRIYRGDRAVIARCPGDAGCVAATAAGAWRIEVALTAPGPHHVILVLGAVGAPPDATREAFLASARAAGVGFVVLPPIDVR